MPREQRENAHDVMERQAERVENLMNGLGHDQSRVGEAVANGQRVVIVEPDQRVVAPHEFATDAVSSNALKIVAARVIKHSKDERSKKILRVHFDC